MHPVIAANPPAAYLGGKRNLAKRLCALIEATPHRVYIEPFVGMGGVFLRRGRAPAAEIINDLAGDVANLFRVIRRHYEPFVDEFTWLLSGRDEFERQKRVDPTTLTDIERAVRFLYLQKLAFGGRITGRTFGVRKDQSARINAATIRAELKKLHQRLQPVTIEQLPYQDVIRRYDSAGALFYLDPPYDETEGYGTGFGRDDFVAMSEQLAGIAGRFIMSINDTPFIRATFAAFEIQEVETTWTLATKSQNRAAKTTELIIRNRA